MKTSKVKLLFAGDFCSGYPERIELSHNIKKLVESCDYNIINFEGPLAKGKINNPNGRTLPQSSDSPSWCEENGFNVISLANNHSLDYNVEGLLSTKNAFKNQLY